MLALLGPFNTLVPFLLVLKCQDWRFWLGISAYVVGLFFHCCCLKQIRVCLSVLQHLAFRPHSYLFFNSPRQCSVCIDGWLHLDHLFGTSGTICEPNDANLLNIICVFLRPNQKKLFFLWKFYVVIWRVIECALLLC